MNLTISNELTGQIYGPIEVSESMTLMDLVALIEAECQFDPQENDLYFNMDIIDLRGDKGERPLSELGMKDDDLLLIRNKISSTPANTTMEATKPEMLSDRDYVEEFRRQLTHNPTMRQQLVAQIPGLESMLNDSDMFYQRMGPVILQRRYMNQQPVNQFGIPQEEYDQLMRNPDDPANKKRITELIDQQAIDEQLRNAYEYTPEVFTTVSMLYVNLEINGHPVKAFVDTGAQMTIMSTRLAQATGLTKLIDKRFVGEVRGVGRGKIIGRIHQAQIKIETQYISGSFVVLDTEIDLLIGLDMLKRHQASIDLAKNVLRIAGIETPFLSEADIPKGFEDEVKQTSVPKTLSTPSKQTVSQTQPVAANPHSSVPINTNTPNPSNNNNANATPSYPESSIKQLMDLGFSRQEVIKALNSTRGNTEYAAALLFQ